MTSLPRMDLARLVLFVSLVVATARISMIEGPFSDNDRSRWATIRALVENETYAIGSRAFENGAIIDRGIVATPGWVSVDVVLDPATGLFYSSKPPLLAFLASFAVKACAPFGFTLTEHRPVVTRVVLVVFQLIPFALALFALHRVLARRFAEHTALRACALAMVGLGSLFATFVVTLNPHVLAGASAIVALWLLDAAGGTPAPPLNPFRLAAAGLCAGFAAAFEPTALAFLVLIVVGLAGSHSSMRARARALVFFIPAAALPVFMHLVTTSAVFGDPFHFFGPLKEWYRFEGSYWQQPFGVDVEDRSILPYAFHLTFGHHGLFSITPLLAVGALGCALSMAGTAHVDAKSLRTFVKWIGLVAIAFVIARALRVVVDAPWQLALVPPALCAAWIARDVLRLRALDTESNRALLVVCSTLLSLGFYIMHTSNYGGIALGPRWLLWLVPLLALGVPRALLTLFDSAQALRVPRTVLAVIVVVALLLGAWLATPRGGLNPWQPPRLAASANA